MEFKDLVKRNGYLKAAFNSYFRYDKENKKWCYERGHYSGRDFYEEIPLGYITQDEWESITSNMVDDLGYDFDAYNWENYSQEDVIDLITDGTMENIIFEEQDNYSSEE